LLIQSVALFVEADLLSPEALKKALVCPDGMIHDAASRLRCSSVTDTCYQPTSPHNPRPCPAKEKERQGCDCDTTAYAQVCRHDATPRDPQARFVYYSGSNRTTDNPNQSTDPAQANKKRGQARFGYRTIPLQLPDPIRRFSLVLLDDFLPANEREENPATALLLQLPIFYPDLEIDAVTGDAGLGYGVFLHTVASLWACTVHSWHTCGRFCFVFHTLSRPASPRHPHFRPFLPLLHGTSASKSPARPFLTIADFRCIIATLPR